MTKYLSAALLATFAMLQLQGQQLEITAGYLSQSEFADHQKISHGKGELYRIGLKYNQPLYAKQNENGDPTLWTMAIQGHLYDLRGTDEAAKQNPDDILNASANVTHIRPISEKWSIIATLGVGIYSAPDEISWSSLLANGGCLFIYKASSTFSIGGGVGLTNAYGAPMVVPMTYLKWNPNRETKNFSSPGFFMMRLAAHVIRFMYMLLLEKISRIDFTKHTIYFGNI